MKHLVLALMLAVASAVPAAAVTTTTQTVDTTLPGLQLLGSNFNVNFNPFNVANQYLTSVTLSYTAGFSANFNVTNVNVTGPLSRQITLERGISSSLTGNGFSLSDSDTVSKTQTVPRFSLLNDFGNYSVSNSQSGTIMSGFGAFTGGPVSFAFIGNNIQNLSGTPNLGLTAAAISNPLAATTAGSFTLTYTSVPEPSSWMMMIIGFGLVGAAARRRVLAIG